MRVANASTGSNASSAGSAYEKRAKANTVHAANSASTSVGAIGYAAAMNRPPAAQAIASAPPAARSGSEGRSDASPWRTGRALRFDARSG